MTDQSTGQKGPWKSEHAVREIARLVWNYASPTQPVSQERLQTLACDYNDLPEQQFEQAVDGAVQAGLIKHHSRGYVSVEGC